jgi:hypothetical protein
MLPTVFVWIAIAIGWGVAVFALCLYFERRK